MKISYHAWKKLITVKELMLSKIMETYIHFSIRKFQPLDLVILLGEEFNAKKILTQYVEKKSLGKMIYDADQKKKKKSYFKTNSAFYEDFDQMELKEV